jgi:hypothetical protein
MKNYFSLFFLIGFLFVFSCGGEQEKTDSSGKEEVSDTISLDTIAKITFQDYVDYQQNLEYDVSNLDSLFAKFQSMKSGLNQEEKDSAYFLYIDLMRSIERDFDDAEDMGDMYDVLLEQYQPKGLTAAGAEGYLWLIVDTSVPGKLFKEDISKDVYAYAMLGEITGKQHSGDAAMMEGYKEWGDIVIDLENRVLENQESKYFYAFLETYNEFLFTFMWGMDNTPIRGWQEEPLLDPEVADAYATVIADDRHNTGIFIQDHIKFLESVSFNYSWDDQQRLTLDEIRDVLIPQELAE